ncbi:hypothetical protein [Patulibacter sp.]|uniref:hypothetical protein n=1 Tax=Patulibacter sp. TaxID=1912859 RepID=UPI0027275488|nr:hypothetical protein [Patulibacter sp.]MDO9409042.1 hypothetical protein [Patulibacter sp.]
MPFPTDASPDALLMTAGARNLLEIEMQDLSATYDSGVRRLGRCPTDPRLTVAGRIAYLDRVLRAAVILHTGAPGPGLVAVGSTVDLLTADGGTLAIRVVAGPGGRERRGALDVDAHSPMGAAVLWQPAGTTVQVAWEDGSSASLMIVSIREALLPVPEHHRCHDLLRALARLRPTGWWRATMAAGPRALHGHGYAAGRTLIDKGRPRDGLRIRIPHHPAGASEGRAGVQAHREHGAR